MARPRSAASSANGANPGFEARLWAAADALRNNMDAGRLSDMPSQQVMVFDKGIGRSA